MATAASYKFHPAANIFPLMGEESLFALRDDLIANGLLTPIELLDGQVIDGRNRLTACRLANIEPVFCEVQVDDPVGYVMSLNFHRRHLTPSQRAAVAVGIEEIEAVKAKERQGTRSDIREKIPECTKGKASEKAAESVGVNYRYVSDAKKIKEQSPEVFEDMLAGKIPIQKAKQQAKSEHQANEAKQVRWPADQKQRRDDCKKGVCVVANLSADSHLVSWARENGLLVRVDRTSPWGNPFVLGDDGNRDQVCDKYAKHYWKQKTKLLSEVGSLKGKVIACHCYPQRCHAMTIAEAANAS